jgi:hypothetical protein
MFRLGGTGLEFLKIPFNEAPRLAPRGLWSVFRNAVVDRRPSPSVAGEARPRDWVSVAVDCETTGAAALTVRVRWGGGGSRDGPDGCGGGGVAREGERDGGSFGTALCTRVRGGGAAWDAGRVGGGGGAARFGRPSNEVPVVRDGGGGGAPRVEELDCEGGGGGTLRGGRLGGAGGGGGGSDERAVTALEGGGGTGRPIVDDLAGGGGGAAG